MTHTIIALWKQHGGSMYGSEAVTQMEHALQTAALARNAGASPALVAAALLHDVGHLLHELPDDAPEQGIDDRHEDLAANYLEKYFRQEVTEPIRLHVDAKRYLCTTTSDYLAQLSEPSVVSLRLQGGLMNEAEIQAFEANPYAADAVRLRRWDDLAKDPEAVTPPIEAFADDLNAGLR
jgi:[1-hydroxy-2-(trimethylamino)ethyl]phosphonate dioxygenase